MVWLISLRLKRLRRLTLQRHYFDQLSYESRAQIDGEAADALKRKADMKILSLKSRLLQTGLTNTEITDYLATSQDVCVARDKAHQARHFTV